MKPVSAGARWGLSIAAAGLAAALVLSTWWTLAWETPGWQVHVGRGRVTARVWKQPAAVSMPTGVGTNEPPGLAWWFDWQAGVDAASLDFDPATTELMAAAPLWPFLAACAIPAAVMWRRHLIMTGRRRRGQCPACGYDKQGLAEGTKCPECGLRAV